MVVWCKTGKRGLMGLKMALKGIKYWVVLFFLLQGG
jgi:hypothetical protein